MGAAREVAIEEGDGVGRLSKVLLRGSSGGAVVWVSDMGDIGANGAEVIGSEAIGIACGFPRKSG